MVEKPRMRDNPYFRCLCNIERISEVEDLVSVASILSGCEIVYSDEAAEMDDLDYVDRVTAYAEGYDHEAYRYHCGSLWARREQDLTRFWDQLIPKVNDIGTIIPILFCTSTISNDLFD